MKKREKQEIEVINLALRRASEMIHKMSKAELTNSILQHKLAKAYYLGMMDTIIALKDIRE